MQHEREPVGSLTRRTVLSRLVGAAAALAAVGASAARAQELPASGRGVSSVAAGRSIQAAVDAAAPGDVVLVEPGTYVETVSIDKPLTVIGVGGHEETVVEADRSRFRWSGLPRERYRVGAFNIVGTTDVVLSGFTVLDALEGVWVSASRRVVVADCMACAHTSSGFYVWASQEVTVARCQGLDNAVGIYQGGSVDISILDSAFTRNRGGRIPHLDDQDYPGTGVLVGNFSRGCRVARCEASDNAAWGLGVSLGVTEVEIRENRFAQNEVGVFAGAQGVTLRRNDITGNRRLGVDAAGECDARWNWWGHASGPGGAAGGEGDAVTPTVRFRPWLEEPVGRPRQVAPRHGTAS